MTDRPVIRSIGVADDADDRVGLLVVVIVLSVSTAVPRSRPSCLILGECRRTVRGCIRRHSCGGSALRDEVGCGSRPVQTQQHLSPLTSTRSW